MTPDAASSKPTAKVLLQNVLAVPGAFTTPAEIYKAGRLAIELEGDLELSGLSDSHKATCRTAFESLVKKGGIPVSPLVVELMDAIGMKEEGV